MNRNLFERALSKGETKSFFCGHGDYFTASKDYQGHIHGANIGGCARVYTENNRDNSRKFDLAFIEYLKRLRVTKEDMGHLLANLASLFSQKSRGGFKESNLFMNKKSEEQELLTEYVRSYLESKHSEHAKLQVLRHAKFIKNKGFSIFNEIIFDLENQLKS